MRWLVLSVLCFACIAGNAQNSAGYHLEQSLKKYSRPSVNGMTDTLSLPPCVKRYQKAPGIYSSSQDGMPCIVPDTKEIVAIPNAGSPLLLFRQHIPNALPPRHPLERGEAIK